MPANASLASTRARVLRANLDPAKDVSIAIHHDRLARRLPGQLSLPASGTRPRHRHRPSAAVTAVGACLLIATHSYRCGAVLCCALVIAGVAAHGLDGQEHLVALGCGLLAGVLVWGRSRRIRHPRL
ncbi:MAG: hypothetical protein WB592_18685 [Acidimicrobiales bacterium]|jgi:hypothetical protein